MLSLSLSGYDPKRRVWIDSLRLDAGSLDDGPPLLDLRLVKGSERLGRLLVAIWDFQPKIGKPLTNNGIGEGMARLQN